MLIRRTVAPAALLLAIIAAGCANNNAIDAGAPAPASSSPADLSGSAGPEPSLPASAGAKPPAATKTITGTVSAGVEPNCLILKDGSGDHLLIFPDTAMSASVKAGSQVTVVGRSEEGIMTTCMQGQPFVVSSVAAE